jgi:hypothetical protein
MRVWWLSLWFPFAIALGGAALAFFTYPNTDASAALIGLAFFWGLVTGKARRTYWNTRLRTRAAMDERQSRA